MKAYILLQRNRRVYDNSIDTHTRFDVLFKHFVTAFYDTLL